VLQDFSAPSSAARVGEAPAGTFNEVEAYSPRRNSWTSHPPMPTARHGLAGRQEAYDAGSNGWGSHPPMPTARHGLGAVAVGGKIYVVSGGPTPGD
jgi:hypothetical protein